MISRTLGSSRKFAALTVQAGPLGEFAQSLYPLLVSCSDDFGRQSGDAFTVKLAVFPSSPRSEAEFEVALAALERVRLIERYEVQGRAVLQIVDFGAHQTGLHKRMASAYPSPFEDVPTRREGKGREEKGTEGKGTEESSVPHAAHEPAVRLTPEAVEPREQRARTRGAVEPCESEDEAGVVLRFPVVGTNGTVWALTDRQVTEWGGLFPTLDVIGEARKALAWILANPGRRKTGRGMLAFLVNWLSRATNMRGRNNGGSGGGGKTDRNPGNAVAFIERGKP